MTAQMECSRSSHCSFPPLPRRRYAIIYADPPWDYVGQTQHSSAGGSVDTGSASTHYDTVPLRVLMGLPVAAIAAKDCLLFIWSSSPHLDQAIALGNAWGFDWATVAFVWDKVRSNPGNYTLSQCELCLVFRRGRIPTPRGARDIRQYLREERGAHSCKPEEVRTRIESMFPTQSKIELFARSLAHGWDAWGLEVTNETTVEEHPVVGWFNSGQLFVAQS